MNYCIVYETETGQIHLYLKIKLAKFYKMPANITVGI